jgi:hypothetical protein
MVPGITMTLGDREWVIPPLTLVQVQEVLPRVQEFARAHPSELGNEQLDVLTQIVTGAMQRNYPDLTLQEVKGMLDLGNTGAVLAAILALKQPPAADAPSL